MVTGEHDLYAMLADAAAQQRDAAALQKYARLAEESAAHYDHKLYLAIADRAWGVAHQLAGQYEEAHDRFKRALELFETVGTRWQIGRTLFELGALARAQTKTEQARDYFSRALRSFEELRAAPDAARTRSALEELSRDE